jgi:hypothetical protein
VIARHRFAIKLIDGQRFARAALAILSGGEGSVATFGPGTSASLPAWAAAHEVRALAKKADVLALGRRKDGTLVAIRRAGDVGIVDLATPWGGPIAVGSADIAGVLTKMLAPPGQPLSAELERGTRRLLSSEDVSVALVVQPGALAPLLPHASCRRDLAAADGALMDDVGVLLRLHPFQWRLEVVWALTSLGRERLEGAASDDGLIDAPRAAAEGIATAGLLLNGFEAIRGAPRPHMLAGGAERAFGALDGCGPVAWVAAIARFWPQLAAMAIEKLTAPVANPSGGLPDALRNVAAVVRALPDGNHGNQGWAANTVFFGSMPGSAASAISESLAQKASGRPDAQNINGREPTFFDLSAATGFSEAGVERIAGGHVGVALTPQAAGLGWYYRLPRRPARIGHQSRIGYLHLNIARLLASWATEADAGTQAAVRLAAEQMGQLGGNMTIDGDFARLELNLSGN